MTDGYVKNHVPLSILPRHIEVWKYIDSFIKANDFAPLVREIAEALNMHDSRVQVTVNELVMIGSVERLERVKRGLRSIRFPVIPEDMKRGNGKS